MASNSSSSISGGMYRNAVIDNKDSYLVSSTTARSVSVDEVQPPSILGGGPRAPWRFVKTHSSLLLLLFVVTLLTAYFGLRRRLRHKQHPRDTDYAAEQNMNLSIRRARALEAMQAEYDRKAREFRELQGRAVAAAASSSRQLRELH
ncbi:hypothetical protein PLESTM_001219500 [Pleodorina starrii]|nr:hypothetical protein PLESTM_001219500 [Pleodorina starrii]